MAEKSRSIISTLAPTGSKELAGVLAIGAMTAFASSPNVAHASTIDKFSQSHYNFEISLNSQEVKSKNSKYSKPLSRIINEVDENDVVKRSLIIKAINDVKKFERANLNLTSPHISLTDEGEINLWWENQNARLDINFEGNGLYYFYSRLKDGIEIMGDDRRCDKQIPTIILEALTV